MVINGLNTKISQADMIMAIKIRANKSDKQDKSVTKMADRFFVPGQQPLPPGRIRLYCLLTDW